MTPADILEYFEDWGIIDNETQCVRLDGASTH